MALNNLLSDIKKAAAKYDVDVLTKNRALKEAESFSKTKLEEIRRRIVEIPPPAHTHALATAGSLARLEASEHSDLDLIITTTSSMKSDSAEIAELTEWRNALCSSLGVATPKSGYRLLSSRYGSKILPSHYASRAVYSSSEQDHGPARDNS
jgi:predicted nucleotidyltransferase